MSAKKLHFRNGCKVRSVHIGGYMVVPFAEFVRLSPAEQCEKCRKGRAFDLNMRNYKEGAK